MEQRIIINSSLSLDITKGIMAINFLENMSMEFGYLHLFTQQNQKEFIKFHPTRSI